MSDPNVLFIPDTAWGVCIWVDDDGRYLSDGDGYLCIEGVLNDRGAEAKLTSAAKYWMGEEFCGRPLWIPDARKVSNDEYAEQVARLAAGLIPDEVDAARQMMNKRKA